MPGVFPLAFLPASSLQEEGGYQQTELAAEACAIADGLAASLDRWELRRLLSGPYDARGAVLSIQARRGHRCAWAATVDSGYES